MTLVFMNLAVTVFPGKWTESVAESEMTPYPYKLHKLVVFTL